MLVAAVSNSAVDIVAIARNISSAESAHAYLFVWFLNHSISSRRRKSACKLAGAVDDAEYIHPVFQRALENEHPFKPCDTEHA